MIRAFKDSYRLSLLIAAIFFVSILASGYMLYTLPHNLMLTDGYQSVFAKAYVVVAITFLLGGFALYAALKFQREVIVYRERSIENEEGENSAVVDENKTTINLEGVRTNLNQANSQKDILQAGLHTICKQLEAGQGALYLANEKEGQRKVELKQGYALSISENTSVAFDFGEGLIGQCAVSGQTLYLDDVPEGYIKIISGLGSASPRYLLIVPVKQNEKILGVMEVASFTSISSDQRKFAEEAAQILAEKITIG
jgi:putative methionine-R-sulfoxide reductase with GAF domain